MTASLSFWKGDGSMGFWELAAIGFLIGFFMTYKKG